MDLTGAEEHGLEMDFDLGCDMAKTDPVERDRIVLFDVPGPSFECSNNIYLIKIETNAAITATLTKTNIDDFVG